MFAIIIITWAGKILHRIPNLTYHTQPANQLCKTESMQKIKTEKCHFFFYTDIE